MKASQNRLIYAHLRDIGPINPQTALDKYSCMRLASRISDLRKAGHSIKSTMVHGLNKYGECVIYAEYTLEE